MSIIDYEQNVIVEFEMYHFNYVGRLKWFDTETDAPDGGNEHHIWSVKEVSCPATVPI